MNTFKYIVLFGVVLSAPLLVSAQGMMMYASPNPSVANQTAQDEAAGKAMFDKLQAKQADCKSLSDDDFDVLGDYYMGQMMGIYHTAMNTMMTQMMGSDGEKQMHIALGKRLSGCDPNAAYPANGNGWLPMMGIGGMMGGWGGYGYSMPYYGWGSGLLMFVWWLLIIAGVVALVRGLRRGGRHMMQFERTPLDILKVRYAKGEIDKQEFEERKKNLN